MILRAILLAAGLALTLELTLPPSPAEAQSFNCRYARKAAEVAICRNGRLSSLDVRMSSIYYGRINRGIDPRLRRRMEADQADWLRWRDACGYDVPCIENAYRRRIIELLRY